MQSSNSTTEPLPKKFHDWYRLFNFNDFSTLKTYFSAIPTKEACMALVTGRNARIEKNADGLTLKIRVFSGHFVGSKKDRDAHLAALSEDEKHELVKSKLFFENESSCDVCHQIHQVAEESSEPPKKVRKGRDGKPLTDAPPQSCTPCSFSTKMTLDQIQEIRCMCPTAHLEEEYNIVSKLVAKWNTACEELEKIIQNFLTSAISPADLVPASKKAKHLPEFDPESSIASNPIIYSSLPHSTSLSTPIRLQQQPRTKAQTWVRTFDLQFFNLIFYRFPFVFFDFGTSLILTYGTAIHYLQHSIQSGKSIQSDPQQSCIAIQKLVLEMEKLADTPLADSYGRSTISECHNILSDIKDPFLRLCSAFEEAKCQLDVSSRPANDALSEVVDWLRIVAPWYEASDLELQAWTSLATKIGIPLAFYTEDQIKNQGLLELIENKLQRSLMKQILDKLVLLPLDPPKN